MRHHHELPLIGFMELCSDQMRHHHEISPRGSWNYALTNEAPPWSHREITPRRELDNGIARFQQVLAQAKASRLSETFAH